MPGCRGAGEPQTRSGEARGALPALGRAFGARALEPEPGPRGPASPAQGSALALVRLPADPKL